MSFILLGILNSQAAGAVGAGTYDLLETEILASSASSVSFTSLNSTYGSTYKHLQIRATMRTDRNSDADFVETHFNSDTGSNYARHQLRANGSTVSSAGFGSVTALRFAGTIPASTDTSNIFSGIVVDFLDFASSSKNTTMRTLGGYAGGQNHIYIDSGLYINTNALDSVNIFSGSGSNFVSGSRFSLYGIKAA